MLSCKTYKQTICGGICSFNYFFNYFHAFLRLICCLIVKINIEGGLQRNKYNYIIHARNNYVKPEEKIRYKKVTNFAAKISWGVKRDTFSLVAKAYPPSYPTAKPTIALIKNKQELSDSMDM